MVDICDELRTNGDAADVLLETLTTDMMLFLSRRQVDQTKSVAGQLDEDRARLRHHVGLY